MSQLIETIVEPMQYGFMQRALLASVMIGATCALLSCFITLRGWALMGDAVSHSVVPGVAIAFLLGLPFALGAFVFGFLSVFLIGFIRSSSRIKEDASMGIVFTGLFAVGLVIISIVPSQIDLTHILFGSLLGVSVSDIRQIAVITALVIAVLVVLRRDLLAWIFDPIHAASIGMRTNLLRYVLLAILALTVTTALQAVGVVLVVAMVITPGATAYLLTDRFDRMLVIASATSIFSCACGTYLSFFMDAATGPLIVTVQTAIFLLVFVAAPRYGLVAQRRPAEMPASPIGQGIDSEFGIL
jgi:manganese transport system permease protein